jgi:uncharacterized protein (DUF1786 family)
MRVLAVDVGTGTQDILLFDSEAELENCIQMVMPSPTELVASRIRQATAAGEGVLLTGVTMGGGPCGWAAEDHLRRGLPLYATPDAARTFDDDLANVERMGVRLTESEALPPNLRRIELRDFDYQAIEAARGAFGVPLQVDAVAVAIFDHGAAPPRVSDRAFRFEYLAETVVQNDLSAFAYLGHEVPERLTRMRAVVSTAPPDLPLLVMDTGPAAILGALEDGRVRGTSRVIVANLGNFHTLAFHIAEGRILGLFEHHTGELSIDKLEGYLRELGDGTISNARVFADRGHGALTVGVPASPPELLAVVGPRRNLLSGSALRPHFAVPHGDMMLAGCFGLLRALARKRPDWAPEIEAALAREATSE